MESSRLNVTYAKVAAGHYTGQDGHTVHVAARALILRQGLSRGAKTKEYAAMAMTHFSKYDNRNHESAQQKPAVNMSCMEEADLWQSLSSRRALGARSVVA